MVRAMRGAQAGEEKAVVRMHSQRVDTLCVAHPPFGTGYAAVFPRELRRVRREGAHDRRIGDGDEHLKGGG